MQLFKISCYSSCGTYFASYLQHVTVLADSKEEAIKELKKWFRKEGRSFINGDSSKWCVEEVTKDMLKAGVVDWHEDSDY